MISSEQFSSLSIGQLVSFFQNKSNEGELKDEAFKAICFSLRGDLIHKCERICKGRSYDIDVAIEVAERTFKKYYKTRSFNKAKCNTDSFDDCFKFYLYRIARNVLNDYYREEQKRLDGQLYDGTEEIVTKIPDVNIDELDIESKLIHEALLSFPYSHQVIFLTYTTYERDGVKLPRKLLIKLREHLRGISQDTVRGYKKEVLDKIETIKSMVSKIKKENIYE